MEWLFDNLVNLVVTLRDWFTGWFVDLIGGIFTLILSLLYSIFDKFLTFFQNIIVSFPVPAAWATADPWASFSPQVLYLFDKFMIVPVLAVLLAGWTIRFALNLIPSVFTRV